MTEFLTSAQMGAIEMRAIDSGQVTGLDLMERAGTGALAELLDHWPDMASAPHQAVILCGPGNNGGDGFVIAHHLRARGWSVALFLYGQPEALPPDARHMYLRWATENPVHRLCFPCLLAQDVRDLCAAVPSGPDSDAAKTHPRPMLFVDALFGIGLSRPLQGFDAIIRHLDTVPAAALRIVAIDVPSGLDADTGQYVADAEGNMSLGFRADLTITFHALKHGHVLGQGPELCGTIRIVDIGLAPWAMVPDA